MAMTPEILAGLAGAILSLIFSYVPKVSPWFAQLDSTQKSAIMALLILAIAGAAYGLSCANVIASIPCTQDGAVRLVQIVFVTLTANQGVYKLSPQVKAK